MKRLHLFELEDQNWFPGWLRDDMTDFLSFVSNHFDLFKDAVPIIEKGFEASNGNRIIDLASGGGGAWKKIAAHLIDRGVEFDVVLTDKYPNATGVQSTIDLFPEQVSLEKEPVDAQDVPSRLAGLRTMFLSFHHFAPDRASEILQNAIDSRQPIAIFEAQKRDFSHLVRFAFSPLGVILTTPFIRPFRWRRFFFTYLLPVIPACVFWDGLVSVLRTYSVAEMLEMSQNLRNSEEFCWESDSIRSGPNTIQYLLGYPSDVPD